MATGHVLPAQKEAVSNLHRVQQQLLAAEASGAAAAPTIKPSFIPENNNRRWLLTQAPVDSERLEAIRRQARQIWSGDGGGSSGGLGAPASMDQRLQQLQQTRQPPAFMSTSYQRHYSAKQLDEPTQLRPTSPNRRNNPHPPLVFLTCRMHNVPGFSNADSATDKVPYQVDAGQSGEQLAARQRQRAKFVNGPDSGALRQYAADNSRDPVQEVSGQKLEFRVSNLGRLDDEDDEDFVVARKRMTDWQQSARPSLHRYLRFQGTVERDRLVGRSSTGQQQQQQQLRAERWRQQHEFQRRCQTAANQQSTNRLVYQPTRVRGDYLIHPMWPPTLPHHRVP